MLFYFIGGDQELQATKVTYILYLKSIFGVYAVLNRQDFIQMLPLTCRSQQLKHNTFGLFLM